jgi:hypothetical protein
MNEATTDHFASLAEPAAEAPPGKAWAFREHGMEWMAIEFERVNELRESGFIVRLVSEQTFNRPHRFRPLRMACPPQRTASLTPNKQDLIDCLHRAKVELQFLESKINNAAWEASARLVIRFIEQTIKESNP